MQRRGHGSVFQIELRPTAEDVTRLHTPSTSTYLSHLSPHYASLRLAGQVNKHPTSPLFTSPSARSLHHINLTDCFLE
ncbi:hypothetical protein ACET3Z_031889 [Daucus carota]